MVGCWLGVKVRDTFFEGDEIILTDDDELNVG